MLHQMTADSLLSHLIEFGGTDLKDRPALAVKMFNELNNRVEFIDEHGQVTCEEKKLTYLKKMVDHQARMRKKAEAAAEAVAEANRRELLHMHPSSQQLPLPPPPPRYHNQSTMFHLHMPNDPHMHPSMVHHQHHQMVPYQPGYQPGTSGGYVNNVGGGGAMHHTFGACPCCLVEMTDFPLQPYLYPVVLACRHFICFGCVMKLQRTIGPIVQAAACPQCRGDIVTRGQSGEEFVQSLLERGDEHSYTQM